MPALMTPWGYRVEGGKLPPLAGSYDFELSTGGAFDIERAERAIESASAAVRSYCGWHVAPALECTASAGGPGKLICLPTLALRSVESVTELGRELSDGEYEWREDGILRRACFRQWPSQWKSVEARFVSGFDPEAVDELSQIVTQIVANCLAASPGVRSEQAGDVSVTFNSTGSGISGGVSLTERDRMMLEPYRLPTMAG